MELARHNERAQSSLTAARTGRLLEISRAAVLKWLLRRRARLGLEGMVTKRAHSADHERR